MGERTNDRSVPSVLRYLHQSKAASRSEVASALGISKAVVAQILRDLAHRGLVVEARANMQPSSRPGRQTVPVSVNPDSGLAIGVDQAGSSLIVVVVDMGLKVRAKFEFPQLPRRARTPENLVFDAVDAVLVGLGPERGDVKSIGIAVPGLVASNTGVVTYSAPFAWSEEPLRQRFESRYELPSVVVNDANAMLVFEVIDSSLASSTVMSIYIGEGIGGGLWMNRQLWLGGHFSAGEWGHIIARENGAQCQCGRFGCLEAEFAIPKVVQRLSEQAPYLRSWEDIVQHHDEEVVQQEFRALVPAVIRGLSSAVAFVDPDEVIICGPVTDIPELAEQLIVGIRGIGLTYAMDQATVRVSTADNGAALGAAYLAAETYFHQLVGIQTKRGIQHELE